MITREELLNFLQDGKTVFDIMNLKSCSKNTVINYMAKYELKRPPGFFNKGGRVGRLPGFKQTEEWKARHRDRMTGAKNPFYGQKHSDSTKTKMSENHADISGDKNPFKNSLLLPGKRQKHQERCRKMWEKRDDEYRRKFGEKVSKLKAEDPQKKTNHHKNHKSGYLETNKAGSIFFRSSWEKLVALALDDHPSVISFELEPYCIKYQTANGVNRHTRIDFLVVFDDGEKAMMEVKPAAIRKLGSNPDKIKAYISHCRENNITFILIGKECNDPDQLFYIISNRKAIS